MTYDISFPVKGPFEARDVTQLSFDIQPFLDELYVPINPYRYGGEKFSRNLVFDLNIKDDQFVSALGEARKIIFSGHRGSGKTMELFRLHKYLNHADRYFSILVNLEREIEVSQFETEDFFILLVTKLAERIHKTGLKFDTSPFDEIANEWLSDREIIEEVEDTAELDIEAKASVGTGLLQLIKLKAGLKTLLSFKTKTAETIRQKVKVNPLRLIEKLNRGLEEVRNAVRDQGLGKDILFIFDGSEKLYYEDYQDLLIKNQPSITAIKASTIISIPIRSYYTLQESTAQNIYRRHQLPMVEIDDESIPKMMEIVTRRIDKERFFEDGVLEKAVEFSGGCPRQLLDIVNESIVNTQGDIIDEEALNTTVDEMGRYLREKLTGKHLEILESRDFNNPADPLVSEMLLELVILKYNGHHEINPLLRAHINDEN